MMGMGIKDANLLIDMLIDITSKNGILLLNVPPKPDGSFANFIKEELYEIGNWLKLNGEAHLRNNALVNIRRRPFLSSYNWTLF